MTKTKEPKYMNIPVKPDVYEKVRLISDANDRGLGAQVAHWVGQELPECDHEKTPVEIEYFPSNDILPGTLLRRTGYFCATCTRVYARVTPSADPTPDKAVKKGEGQ